jgi:hypothetical protein
MEDVALFPLISQKQEAQDPASSPKDVLARVIKRKTLRG